MTPKAAAGPLSSATPRRLIAVGLAALFVVALLVLHAGAPYLFKRATLLSEIATQVRATTGLTITSQHVRFDLLPRPRVTMTGVQVRDASGSLKIDTDRLDGDVRLLPLIVGRLELAAATLAQPHLFIDLDGRPIKPDSMIGRAMQSDDTRKNAAERRLGIITFVGGSADIKGKWLGRLLTLTDIDVTVDWRDLNSSATLTGSLRMNNTTAEIATWIAQPSSLMRGGHSALALRVHAVPLDASITGDLAIAASNVFKGHVTASAPSAATLIEIGAPNLALPAPFADLAIDSEIKLEVDGTGLTAMALQSLRCQADGNAYEGTLAYQGGSRKLVSGTLATDRLVMAPFIAQAPMGAARVWTKTSEASSLADPVNLDVRISATHLRWAPFTVDDAALSVMTRGDRTEIGINEAKAYGGEIKGRISIGFNGDGLNLRGAGTLTNADAATLGWDALGRQVATGTLSGAASLDSTGRTPAALLAHLQGWAKARASDGEISGLDLGGGLAEAGHVPAQTTLPQSQSGRTPYDSADIGVRIADGIATVDGGSLRGADSAMVLSGAANVGARTLELHAAVHTPKAAVSTPGLRVDVEGGFDNFTVVTTTDSGSQGAPHN